MASKLMGDTVTAKGGFMPKAAPAATYIKNPNENKTTGCLGSTFPGPGGVDTGMSFAMDHSQDKNTSPKTISATRADRAKKGFIGGTENKVTGYIGSSFDDVLMDPDHVGFDEDDE